MRRNRQPNDLPLFRAPMARQDDPATSRATAAAIEPVLGKLQRIVLEVFRAHGAMTAREAERLAEFDGYGFSTVRKRISELAAGGYLVAVGTESEGRSPATVYEVAREVPDAS